VNHQDLCLVFVGESSLAGMEEIVFSCTFQVA
jgi:hypothetical protein